MENHIGINELEKEHSVEMFAGKKTRIEGTGDFLGPTFGNHTYLPTFRYTPIFQKVPSHCTGL